MNGWKILCGTAIALPQSNIDTDQLIPARFMSQPRSEGYGDFLLYDVRKAQQGHPLDRSAPKVLVAGRNFGSGSSREAAVYALVDYGISAVFAPSFGDIFAGNAVNNGLLAAQIDEDVAATLIADMGEGACKAEVDLISGRAIIAGHDIAFDLDPVRRQKLINGWDDIDLTAQYSDQIKTYRAAHVATRPWATPEI
ncbi:3-isopropylmalate dehydratase small subunit [uncultured Sulfitobacter sp.]|uniref:3-isopropylmalate dehydratase small subunit n=1 Tax=uncultured Sulfitobacter sp. TaxID=191468 RepID=UPI002605833B|nr:3-isopropylmalate dehydratase small subunit [uncultured Sulfitobacter sp.]